ncbi:MAG: hypothetical protein HKN35_04055 [Woeseia sp.]|nr:hypothetical protein [Woeseia sp.]NNE60041.1 hypothetical protein [Woeseia sp.]
MPENSEQSGSRVSLEYLEGLHRRIEEHAAGSNWPDVEALMAERNKLLGEFPAAERPAALQAAKKSTDRILALAKSARLELGGELAKLQEGRKATDIYRAHR